MQNIGIFNTCCTFVHRSVKQPHKNRPVENLVGLTWKYSWLYTTHNMPISPCWTKCSQFITTIQIFSFDWRSSFLRKVPFLATPLCIRTWSTVMRLKWTGSSFSVTGLASKNLWKTTDVSGVALGWSAVRIWWNLTPLPSPMNFFSTFLLCNSAHVSQRRQHHHGQNKCSSLVFDLVKRRYIQRNFCKEKYKNVLYTV